MAEGSGNCTQSENRWLKVDGIVDLQSEDKWLKVEGFVDI